MALDRSVIGLPSTPAERSWTSTDTLLYALGVGAGQTSAAEELSLTTENSHDVTQQVLPTFAVLAAQAPSGRSIGQFDPAMLVHAEQAFTVHHELPVAGTVEVTSTVTGMYDKGSGALVTSEARAVDKATGQSLVTSASSVFIRGEGGFGGSAAPPDTWKEPDRAPDSRITYPTRPDQALLYRLSGDRNPLHSDPVFARRAGFERPILHGLCTYGVTGRALMHLLCNSEPARLESMSGRFTKPVYPGENLTISVWHNDSGAQFRTSLDDGTIVLDRGTVTMR